MKDKRKPRGTVRPATKTEAHNRARAAMQQRNDAITDRRAVVQRMMELEIIIGALVAREGRVRLTDEELTAEYTPIKVRQDGDCIVIECGRLTETPAPGEALGALLKGGFSVVEDLKGEQPTGENQ